MHWSFSDDSWLPYKHMTLCQVDVGLLGYFIGIQGWSSLYRGTERKSKEPLVGQVLGELLVLRLMLWE